MAWYELTDPQGRAFEVEWTGDGDPTDGWFAEVYNALSGTELGAPEPVEPELTTLEPETNSQKFLPERIPNEPSAPVLGPEPEPEPEVLTAYVPEREGAALPGQPGRVRGGASTPTLYKYPGGRGVGELSPIERGQDILEAQAAKIESGEEDMTVEEMRRGYADLAGNVDAQEQFLNSLNKDELASFSSEMQGKKDFLQSFKRKRSDIAHAAIVASRGMAGTGTSGFAAFSQDEIKQAYIDGFLDTSKPLLDGYDIQKWRDWRGLRDLDVLSEEDQSRLAELESEHEANRLNSLDIQKFDRLYQQAGRRVPIIGEVLRGAAGSVESMAKKVLDWDDVRTPKKIDAQINRWNQYAERTEGLSNKQIEKRKARRDDAVSELELLKSERQKDRAAISETLLPVSDFVVRVTDYFDPAELKREDISEQLSHLKTMDSASAAALYEGRVGMVVEKYLFQMAASGNEAGITAAMELNDRAREISQQIADGNEDAGAVKKLWLDTLRIIPPMAEGAAKNLIPVIGQAWSVYDWAQQGAGSMYSQMRKAGVDHDTAMSLVPAAGLLYALVERAQVKGLTNIGKSTAGEGIRSALLNLAKKKGIDWGTEVAEESVQRLVSDAAVEIAKSIGGVQDKDIGEVMLGALGGMAEEAKGAVGPMGVLSLFGLGVGTARIGLDAKTRGGEWVTDAELFEAGAKASLKASRARQRQAATEAAPVTQGGLGTEAAPVTQDQEPSSSALEFRSRAEAERWIRREAETSPDEAEVDNFYSTHKASDADSTPMVSGLSRSSSPEEAKALLREAQGVDVDDDQAAQFLQRVVDESESVLVGDARQEFIESKENLDIVRPDDDLLETFSGEDSDRKKEKIKESLDDIRDPVVPGTYRFSRVELAMRKWDKLGVPYYVFAADGGNLGGWNKEHGNVHDLANPAIAEVWGSAAETVRELGGIIGRNSDEFKIAIPHITEADAAVIKKRISDRAAELVKKNNAQDVVALKGEFGGVPLGSLWLDIGYAKAEPGKYKEASIEADRGANAEKMVRQQATAAEKGWVPEVDENGKVVGYVSGSAEQEVGPQQGRGDQGDTGGQQEGQQPADQDEGGKGAQPAYSVREDGRIETVGGDVVSSDIERINKSRLAAQARLLGVKPTGDTASTRQAVYRAREERRGESVPVRIMGEDQQVTFMPTPAQAEAGNYKKGQIKIPGLPEILVETPRNMTREGVDQSGNSWQTTMSHHYGYFRGSVGRDKDQIDTFVKEGARPDQPVFIVNQINPDTGNFDEHKVMLGFDSESSAKTAYLSNYEPGWGGLGSIVKMEPGQFAEWVKSPQKSPATDVSSETEAPVETVATEPADDVVETKTDRGNKYNREGRNAVRRAVTTFREEARKAKEQAKRDREAGRKPAFDIDENAPDESASFTGPLSTEQEATEEILKSLGFDVYFYESPTKAMSSAAGFVREGEKRPAIYINVNAKTRPSLAIALHEAIHNIRQRNPELYRELITGIAKYLKGDYLDSYIKWHEGAFLGGKEEVARARRGSDASFADWLTEEMVANIASFSTTNKSFMDRLAEVAPEAIKQILKYIDDVLKKILRAKNLSNSAQSLADATVTDIEAVRAQIINVLKKQKAAAEKLGTGKGTRVRNQRGVRRQAESSTPADAMAFDDFEDIEGAEPAVSANTPMRMRYKPTGEEYYVKFAFRGLGKTKKRIANTEVLASKLAKALGLNVPEVRLVTVFDEKNPSVASEFGVASKVVDASPANDSLYETRAEGVIEGYGIIALLGAVDSPGAWHQNILIDNKSGEAVWIDFGAALGQDPIGAPIDFLESPEILGKMTNPTTANWDPYTIGYINLFGDEEGHTVGGVYEPPVYSREEMIASLEAVANTPDKTIEDMVMDNGALEEDDPAGRIRKQDDLIRLLKARRDAIGEIAEAARVEGDWKIWEIAKEHLEESGVIVSPGTPADTDRPINQDLLALQARRDDMTSEEYLRRMSDLTRSFDDDDGDFGIVDDVPEDEMPSPPNILRTGELSQGPLPPQIEQVVRSNPGTKLAKGALGRFVSAIDLEKSIRSLRGKAVWRQHKYDQLMEDRAKIETYVGMLEQSLDEYEIALDITDMNLTESQLREALKDDLRALVRDYADAVGFHGKVVETGVLRTATTKQLVKRIEMIDRHAAQRMKRQVIVRGKKVAKNFEKRIQKIRGGKANRHFTQESVDFIEHYGRWINGETEPLIGERIALDIADGKAISQDEQRFYGIWQRLGDETQAVTSEDIEWYSMMSMASPDALDAQDVADVTDLALKAYRDGRTKRQDEIAQEEQRMVKEVGEIIIGAGGTPEASVVRFGDMYYAPNKPSRWTSSKGEATKFPMSTATDIVDEFRNSRSIPGFPDGDAGSVTIEAAKQPHEEARRMREERRRNSSSVTKWRNALSDVKWSMMTPEAIGEYMTDNYYLFGMEKGPVSKYIVDRLQDAAITEAANIQEHANRMRETFQGIDRQAYNKPILDADGNEVRISYMTFDNQGNPVGRTSDSITLSEAMHLYANSLNAKNRAHLEGTGIDFESIMEVKSALPDNAKAAVDEWVAYYDNEMYPRISTVFKSVYGLPMGKETNYFPLMRLDTKMSNENVIVDLMQRQGSIPLSVYKKFVKSRVGSRAPFKEYDFFGVIGEHMRHTEHYIAFEGTVNTVRRLLKNPEVAAAMREKNDTAFRQLYRWADEMTQGHDPEKLRGWEQVNDMLVKNYAVFALGINPRVMLKQLGSYPLGILYSKNPGLVAKYAQDFLVPGQHDVLVTDVLERSDFMRGRQGKINSELEDFRNSKEFAEMSGATKGQRAIAQVRDGAMAGIRGLDAATVFPLWMASYQHQRRNLGKSEEESVRYADTVIKRTQPTGGKENLSQAFREKGLVRWFTMFRNVLNKQYNITAQLARAVRYADIPPEKKFALVVGNMMAYMASTMWLYMVDRAFVRLLIPGGMTKIVTGKVRQGLKDLIHAGEESWDDIGTIGRYLTTTALGGFVGAGDTADFTLNVLNNMWRKSRGLQPLKVFKPSHTLPFENMMLDGASALEDAIKAMGAVSDENYEEAIKQGMDVADYVAEFIGSVTPVAPGMAYRMGKGITRVEEWTSPTSEAGPLNVFYSQGALEDRSMKAAMAKRLMQAKSADDKVVFLRWYGSLSPEGQQRFREYLDERVIEDPQAPGLKRPLPEGLIDRYRMTLMFPKNSVIDPSQPLPKKIAKPKMFMPTARDNGMILHSSGPLSGFASKAQKVYTQYADGYINTQEYGKKLARLRREEDAFIEKLASVGVKLVPNIYGVSGEAE